MEAPSGAGTGNASVRSYVSPERRTGPPLRKLRLGQLNSTGGAYGNRGDDPGGTR